jgi:hypothetical protein
VTGFSWFCPGGCTLGQPGPFLATGQGLLSITPTGPVESDFAATLDTPEPPAMLLIAAGIAVLIFRRGRSLFGLCASHHGR